jgi:hypothetical protein
MRIRKALRKIHRWVGLLSALWLLQLAITGLLLQHADDFKLTQSYVSSPTVLKWFGYGTRQQIWDLDQQVIYQVDEVVGFSAVQVKIAAPLIGAALWQDQWLVATADTLYGFNQQGETVLQLDDFDGVPTPISALSAEKDSLHIQVNDQWFSMLPSGEFQATTQTINQPSQARSMTTAEQQQFFAVALQDKLSYDKVLHGIHAGIQGSKWLNSLSALALLFLCFSGIYLFFKQPKRK